MILRPLRVLASGLAFSFAVAFSRTTALFIPVRVNGQPVPTP